MGEGLDLGDVARPTVESRNVWFLASVGAWGEDGGVDLGPRAQQGFAPVGTVGFTKSRHTVQEKK